MAQGYSLRIYDGLLGSLEDARKRELLGGGLVCRNESFIVSATIQLAAGAFSSVRNSEELSMQSYFMRHKLVGALRISTIAGLAACQQQEMLPEKPPTRVQAQEVELTDYAPTITLTGEIRAQVQTNLAFRASGRIIERNADIGDHVTADQVLARLDPEEQQANVDAAEGGQGRRGSVPTGIIHL
jgi:hypothetical protein